jgi:hypothetical protein
MLTTEVRAVLPDVNPEAKLNELPPLREGGVAEWSKAPDLGSGLSRRGFEPHLRQAFSTRRRRAPAAGKKDMRPVRIELTTLGL